MEALRVDRWLRNFNGFKKIVSYSSWGILFVSFNLAQAAILLWLQCRGGVHLDCTRELIVESLWRVGVTGVMGPQSKRFGPFAAFGAVLQFSALVQNLGGGEGAFGNGSPVMIRYCQNQIHVVRRVDTVKLAFRICKIVSSVGLNPSLEILCCPPVNKFLKA